MGGSDSRGDKGSRQGGRSDKGYSTQPTREGSSRGGSSPSDRGGSRGGPSDKGHSAQPTKDGSSQRADNRAGTSSQRSDSRQDHSSSRADSRSSHYDDRREHREDRYDDYRRSRFIRNTVALGVAIATLPRGYTTVYVGTTSYYYYDGVYYVSSSSGYTVVHAPTRVVVKTIPASYKVVYVGPRRYYYYGGTYYIVNSSSEYVVVEAPAGAMIYELPEGAKPMTIHDDRYYFYGGTYKLRSKKRRSKMKKAKRALGLIFSIIVTALILTVPAFAQAKLNAKDQSTLSRSFIELNRKAIVAVNLGLTEEESKAFWPVYTEYRDLVDTINDSFLELLNDYAQNYQDLSDRMAVNLLNDFLDIEMDRVASKKAYIEEFSRVLPPQKVAKYFQIENKMDTIIKAELVMKIPLIEVNQDSARGGK